MALKKISLNGKTYEPYVNDDGIYMPIVCNNNVCYLCVVTKGLFIEAYNKWIKNNNASKYDCLFNRQDELDNWWGDD